MFDFNDSWNKPTKGNNINKTLSRFKKTTRQFTNIKGVFDHVRNVKLVVYKYSERDFWT